MTVRACALPQDALLQRYAAQSESYVDCYQDTVPGPVDLPAFVATFYTTWVFRLERWVLTVPLRRRVRDAEVEALAEGADRFAIWEVVDRGADQILLRAGTTRSWLATRPGDHGQTQLLFGSAVVATPGLGLPLFMRALTPFHRLYSIALLGAAARRLRRRKGSTSAARHSIK